MSQLANYSVLCDLNGLVRRVASGGMFVLMYLLVISNIFKFVPFEQQETHPGYQGTILCALQNRFAKVWSNILLLTSCFWRYVPTHVSTRTY